MIALYLYYHLILVDSRYEMDIRVDCSDKVK